MAFPRTSGPVQRPLKGPVVSEAGVVDWLGCCGYLLPGFVGRKCGCLREDVCKSVGQEKGREREREGEGE